MRLRKFILATLGGVWLTMAAVGGEPSWRAERFDSFSGPAAPPIVFQSTWAGGTESKMTRDQRALVRPLPSVDPSPSNVMPVAFIEPVAATPPQSPARLGTPMLGDTLSSPSDLQSQPAVDSAAGQSLLPAGDLAPAVPYYDQEAPLELGEELCDRCGHYGLLVHSGFESFRSHADSIYADNFGYRVAANLGLPFWPSHDIGCQLGASYGVYDWNGRANQGGGDEDANNPLHQVFITLGVFQNCNWCEGRRWSWGVGYDWMIAQNFGDVSQDLTVTQGRGQIAYALSASCEIGVDGTIGDRNDADDGLNGESRYKATSRIDTFLRRTYCTGAETKFWLGFTEGNAAFDRPGNALCWVAGVSGSAPISDCWSLYGQAQYGHPSGPSGGLGFLEGGNRDVNTTISCGFVYTPHGRRTTVCGCPWTPYLPVANNMSFVTDDEDPFGF